MAATALTKRFPGRRGPVVALDRVDLVVPGGQVVAVVGPAGSGRTTLVRCLAGAYRADGGTVHLAAGSGSLELTSARSRALAWLRSGPVAVHDGPLAAPPRQAAVAAIARTARCAADVAHAGLARLGAEELADVPVGALRPAEAAVVGLVATLLRPAEVLLLDDPLAVAPVAAAAEWLRERADAGAAVLATADPDVAPALAADVVHAIDEGAVRCLTS